MILDQYQSSLKRVVLLFVAIAIFQNVEAQTNAAVKMGETLVFEASYNMSGLGTKLAEVTMTTQKVKTSKSELMHLRISAATYAKWDGFFKIRDLYESYVNPKTLNPRLYKRDISEGGYTKQMKYVYQPSKKTIAVTKTRKGVKTPSTVPLKPDTYDIVASLFRLRNHAFDQMQPNQTKKLNVVFDGKEYQASLKYLGRETIKAGPLGSKSCYKISVSANTDKLTGKDKNLIWFTADDRKVPVKMSFSIPVGTGELILKHASDKPQ